MAAVQSVHAMTLGQNSKMFNNNYQVIPGQNNCVIVSTGIPSQTAIHQGKRLLAPTSADHRTTVLVNTLPGVPSDSRCKKKLQYQHHLPYGSAGHQPASVARRNARERNRVKQVNNGFATLRQHIPSNVAAALSTTNGRGASKKLSKVDTLRMAVEYIRSLKELLDENDTDAASTSTGHSSHESQSYYEDSPGQHMGHPRMMVQTPPSSEASASPTPSYSSDGSMSVAPTTYLPASSYPKTEHYDSYEPMSPEDEELLDVISWWQQQ